MGLLRMGKKVKGSPEGAIEAAVSFFGKEGVGLTLMRRSETSAYFAAGGGHVQVTATPVDGDEGHTDIDVQTRDWEYDVKRFVAKI